MFLCHFLLLFAGTVWTIDGAIVFSKEPRSPVYFMERSTALLEWAYPEEIKATELKSVSWGAKNKTSGDIYILLVDPLTGGVIAHPNIIPLYKGRVNKTNQATLVIKNVAFDDSRTFICRLKSKLDVNVEVSSSVQLVVTGQSSVNPTQAFFEVGGTASFTCNATGVPSHVFAWTRQGKSEKIVNDGRHLITSYNGSSVITIKDLLSGDSGHYVCSATVNANQENLATAFLQVLSLKSEGPYDVTICGSQTISCPVTGYPPPIVTWEKNGTQLQKGENTTLSITSVKDYDNYTCTATNVVTSLEPINIGVVRKCVEISLKCSDGTAKQPAKVEWSPLDGASYYVLETAGDDVRDDLVIGTTSSLEIHYLTLVMKKADEKPEEMEISVSLSAMGDENVLAKAACDLTLKRPNDVEY